MTTDNKIVKVIESTQTQLKNKNCVAWKDTRNFREILEMLLNSFQDEASPVVLDEESEKEILVMFQYYQNACIRGNEKTARQILTSIVESINYLRMDRVSETTYSNNSQQFKRIEKISRLRLLLHFQDCYDELNCRIQKMEENEDELLNKIAEAEGIVDEFQDEREYYETHVLRIKNHQEPPAPEILDYVNKVNMLADSKNAYARSLLLKEKLIQRGRALNESIQNINLIVFGTSEILGKQTIESLMQTMSQFEENLRAQQIENKEIHSINNRMDQAISQIGTSYEEEVSDTAKDTLMANRMKMMRDLKQ